jgi:hypothetical protein
VRDSLRDSVLLGDLPADRQRTNSARPLHPTIPASSSRSGRRNEPGDSRHESET